MCDCFSAENRAARKPALGEVARLTEFILSNFHRRRIFVNGKLARLSDISVQISSFANKLEWRAALAKEEIDDSRKLVKTGPPVTPPCRLSILELAHTCSELAESLLQHCRRARARKKLHRRKTPGVVQYALEINGQGWRRRAHQQVHAEGPQC